MTDEEYELERETPVTEAEKERYHSIMDQPLNEEEKSLLISGGWMFNGDH